MLEVTPHVGVWIETIKMRRTSRHILVTPHVGVWIETFSNLLNFTPYFVTPHVGVWIETLLASLVGYRLRRHSPCGSVD